MNTPKGRFLISILCVALLSGFSSDARESNATIGPDAVIPVAGSTAGGSGANFRTEAQAHNPSSETMRGRFVWIPQGSTPGANAEFELGYELAPRQTFVYEDLIDAMGATGLGSIDIYVDEGTLPSLVVRAFDDKGEAGTTGLMVPVIPADKALVAGRTRSIVVPNDLVRYRFNIGVRTLQNEAGESTMLRLQEYGSTGLPMGESVVKTYLPDVFMQVPGADFLGRPLTAGSSILVEVVSGRLFMYSTTVDNVTNDGSIQIDELLNLPPEVDETDIQVETPDGTPISIPLAPTDPDGDDVEATLGEGPSNGIVTIEPGDEGMFTVLYTPDGGFGGEDTFEVILDDGNGGQTIVTITVTVGGLNTSPFALGEVYTMIENQTLFVPPPGVLDNDTDADSDPLTAVLESPPTPVGAVTLDADGSFGFTPPGGFIGTATFTYRASDGKALSPPATVTIIVKDSDVPPTAIPDSATTDEDTPISIPVIANDSDDRPVGELNLTGLNATGTLGSISIAGTNVDYDPTTSPVLQAMALGDSTIDTFQYTITDVSFNTASATVTVTVNGVNDAPTITSDGGGATAAVNAAENQTAVTDVQSTDPEGDTEGAGLTYSKTGGADQALFTLDASTGVLTFASAPDFDIPGDANSDNNYEVQVTVTDSGGLTDVQDITVTLTNVNEAPAITSDGGGATAAVNAAENQTAVTDVESTDPEGETENGGGLTYSKTGGADQALFTLDTSTGVLTFNSAPDFETPGDANTDNDYEVQVTVTDSGALTDVQDITVTVTDVNEAPTITSNGGGATAAVNVPENTTAVTDVQSTDPEGETENGGGLTYSKTGGADQALFTLNTATGVLTFTSAPDFETPGDADTDNDYEVQVTVTDSGALTDVQDITVTVTDANDPPSITSNGGGATASVNVAENTTAVTDVQSTDPEGDTENGGGLTYSKTGGADQALFTLNTATGVLAFASAPDFDVPGDANTDNDYEVQVTVTDSGGLTDVQDITVTVTDVNEAPVITSNGGGATAAVNVPENTTAVTDVQSTDPEGETENGGGLTYSKTGGADQALFTLNTATGVLTFTSAPDFEAPGDAGGNNVYDVQVTVTDGGALTDVQDIAVTVTDGNEAPTITSNGGGATASVNAAENQTAVTDVQSTDPEGDTEGSGLTYSKTGGADQALFTLNTTTGVLTFTSPRDFETPGDAGGNNVYDVQVTVTDSVALTDVQDIAVTVTNVNETPAITSNGGGATAAVNVPENTTAVTDVQSTDPDGETENGGGLTYSKTGGADQALFTLNTATGVLTFTSAPDFEAPGDVGGNNVYDVQVTVTDAGALTDVQDIAVTVTDGNEVPIGGADSFDFIGNTLLLVDKTTTGGAEVLVSTTGGTTPAADGVLDNDVDDGPISVSGITSCGDVTAPFTCTTANGGWVTMESNGQFSYVPGTADATLLTDFFSYILFDGSSSVTVAVTLNRQGLVWYVQNNHPGNKDGTSVDPFDLLSAAENDSSAGDTIYVFEGDGTTGGQDAGITLQPNQRLLGAGVALTVPVAVNGGSSPTTLLAAGTEPKISNSTGNAVTVTDVSTPIGVVEIRGLDISASGAGNNAIDVTVTGSNAGSATIANNTISGSGAEGVDVNSESSQVLAVSITNNAWTTTAASHTGNAIDLRRVEVSPLVLGGTLEIELSNNTSVTSSAAAIFVDGDTSGAATITGFSGNTVHQNTVGAGISISNATFDATAGGNLDVVSGGATVVGTTGDGVGGSGISLTSVTGHLNFTDLDVVNSNGAGLVMTGTGQLTATTGTQLTVQSGSAAITSTSGAIVDISNATLDTTFTTLTSTNTALTGVSLSSVTGVFSAGSGSSILNPVSLTNNTGATMSFAGGLLLNTSTNAAFIATGGGTVNVTGTNTITTTTGTALNVANTDIGASGLTFRSITTNGAVNGIILNTTGSSGGLTVTGTGTAGTGGTIQNTTGDAISITDAQDVVLSSITISSPTGHGFIATDLRGTNRINGSSVIEGINGLNKSGVWVRNTNTDLTLIELDASTFRNSSSSQSFALFETLGTSSMGVTVNGSTFTNLFAQAVTAASGQTAASTGAMTTSITNNQFTNAYTTGGVFGENNVGVVVANGATQSATISTNTFNNITKDGSVANTSVLRTQNNGGTWTGTISGNTISNINILNGTGRHGIGHVFDPPATGLWSSEITITNNAIDDLPAREAIFVDYRANAGGGKVTVTNNNIGQLAGSVGAIGGGQEAMELRFRQTTAQNVALLVSGNTVTATTTFDSDQLLDVDAEDLVNLNATVTGNSWTQLGTGTELMELSAEDAGTTACYNVSGDTLTTGSIDLVHGAGTMNISTHADTAAMSTANGGASVGVSGATANPTFGSSACTLP